MLATLEKKALRDTTREELRRKQAELNEARTLQLALAPPAFDGTLAGQKLSIEVVLEPAKEVGGDLVDHFTIGEDLLVLLLGDVSDKGAGAALMMARTHSMFRSLAGRPDAAELFSEPAKAISLVNNALSVGNESCMFVTFLLATLNVRTRQLTYVRAGHIPPFQRDGSDAIARLATRGRPSARHRAGLRLPAGHRHARAGRSPADRHRRLHRGQRPGWRALRRSAHRDISRCRPAARTEALQQLVEQVREFEAGRPAFDDMAAILLSVSGGAT